MDPNTFTTLVQTLQITVITALIFLAGLSSTLSLLLIPLTTHLPAPLLARQFTRTYTWGGRYLQPLSRLLALSLLLTSVLTSRLPNPEEAGKWRDWAVCLGVLGFVAPWEVWCIFWINDRVGEIGRALEGTGRKEEGEVKRELKELLGKWRVRNSVRVLCPLVAGVVGLLSVVRR